MSVAFDIDRLADKVKSHRVDQDPLNANLRKFFHPTSLGDIDDTCTVVDIHGRVILWFLPDILFPFRVVSGLILDAILISIYLYLRPHSASQSRIYEMLYALVFHPRDPMPMLQLGDGTISDLLLMVVSLEQDALISARVGSSRAMRCIFLRNYLISPS